MLASGWLALWGEHLGLGAALGATMRRAEWPGRGGCALDAGLSRRRARGVLVAGQVAVNAHLHGAVALLHVAGSGLETTASNTVVQFGGLAGASLTWRRWRAARPWVGADLLAWPGRERLRVVGLAEQATLPRLEIHLAVGLEFGLFR